LLDKSDFRKGKGREGAKEGKRKVALRFKRKKGHPFGVAGKSSAGSNVNERVDERGACLVHPEKEGKVDLSKKPTYYY